MVGVHLYPVPTAVGDHYCGDALDHGAEIALHMDAKEPVEVNHRVVLVNSVGSAAISKIVLSTRCDILPFKEKFTNQLTWNVVCCTRFF